MHITSAAKRVLLAITIAASASCAGSHLPPVQLGGEPTTLPDFGALGLPSPDEIKEASFSFSLECDGSDFVLSNEHVSADGTDAVLNAPEDDFAWAIYSFSAADYKGTYSISCNWEGGLPPDAYFGIADYSKNHWLWVKFDEPSVNLIDTFSITDPADVLRPSDGVLYFTCITAAGSHRIQDIQAGERSDNQICHTWGGSDDEFIFDIACTEDGKACMIGSTRSYGAGEDDLLIMLVDKDGILLWAKTWGTEGNECGRGVYFYDSSFFVCGDVMLDGEYHYNTLVQRWDLDGNCLASTMATTDDEFDDLPNDIHVSSSAVFVAGFTYNVGNLDRWDCDAMFIEFTPGLEDVTRMWRWGGEECDDPQVAMHVLDDGDEDYYLISENIWPEIIQWEESVARFTRIFENPEDMEAITVAIDDSVEIAAGALDGDGAYFVGSCTDQDDQQEAFILRYECTEGNPDDICPYAVKWSVDDEWYTKLTGAACYEGSLYAGGTTGEPDPGTGFPLTSNPVALTYSDNAQRCSARVALGVDSVPIPWVEGCGLLTSIGDIGIFMCGAAKCPDVVMSYTAAAGTLFEPVEGVEVVSTDVNPVVLTPHQCQWSEIEGTLTSVTSELICDSGGGLYDAAIYKLKCDLDTP